MGHLSIFSFLVEASRNPLHRLHEPQRRRIHAIPQPRRLGTIVKHMPQVGVTLLARNRNPLHAHRIVAYLPHILTRNRCPEAGPARAESNFVSELNSALSQQMQRKSPLSCRFQYFPVYAISVSACRVISNSPA